MIIHDCIFYFHLILGRGVGVGRIYTVYFIVQQCEGFTSNPNHQNPYASV